VVATTTSNVSIGANAFVICSCFFDNDGSLRIQNDYFIEVGVYFVSIQERR
jgi:hypothetical protein